MKKALATVSAVLIVAGSLVTGGAAQAVTTQEVSGVSAYYRVDLGYMVGWQLPASRSGVTGYVVTASNGATCNANSSGATSCTFKAAQLGYTGSFNFTVATKKGASVVAVSGASNTVGAMSIPTAPLLVTADAVSDSQINVAWVPSSGTGNLPLYGYKITYWKSNSVGGPDNSTRVDIIATETRAELAVDQDALYIINVASCNALGCNSADYWAYASTTPDSEAVKSITLPTVIGGGRADTTCFDSIYDANAGETASGSCGSVVADPATYPVIDANATILQDPELATKFANKATLSNFLRSYSLKTWQPIGIPWFSRLTATSKSVTLGFTTAPNVLSTSPTTCEVVGDKIVLKAVGTCSLIGSVAGNGTFKPSNVASIKFSVTK